MRPGLRPRSIRVRLGIGNGRMTFMTHKSRVETAELSAYVSGDKSDDSDCA